MQKHSVVPDDVQCPGEKNLYLTRCVRCRGIKNYQNIVLLISNRVCLYYLQHYQIITPSITTNEKYTGLNKS